MRRSAAPERVHGAGPPSLCCGILVGGPSRRMGQPKALLTPPGGSETILETLVDVLRPWGPVFLLGTPPFDLPSAVADLPAVPDRAGVPGPLGALLAAFDTEPRAAWLLASCDLPRVRPAAVRWLLARRRPGAFAITPTLDRRRIEPLFALWEPSARMHLEQLADERIATSRGRGRVGSFQSLRHHAGVLSPRPPARLRAAWQDVDTPVDWERLGP